jgi:RNA polymerase sigma-70 factor (ECF subfamily)
MTAPAGSEADLVQRCLEGDPAAWDVLVRTYWRRVFHIAYKFVARYDEAEDLTQDIFVKLFRSLGTYDRRANFDTWLSRITRNLCIDRYRRRRRESSKLTDDVDPDALSLEQLVSRPDTTLEQRDEVAAVRRALAKLPPAFREAVALRDIQELSYEEIARRLQLPEGTVKSRINRGRRELARHLRVFQGLEPEPSNHRRRVRPRQEGSHANDQDHHRDRSAARRRSARHHGRSLS